VLKGLGEIADVFFLSGISGNKSEISGPFYSRIGSASVEITPEY
jgi:hypothetical protein